MKEVKVGRMVDPFDKVPFENYIQSPIGLVPKKGNKTRLIFHLSFTFGEGPSNSSVNGATPKEDCSVKYNHLDTAICNCIEVARQAQQLFGLKDIFLGKTDLSNAFRVLPLRIASICWLVLKAQDPEDKKWKFFMDKCLPFGASISCPHYQRFSNALHHIMEFRTACHT